MKTFLYGLGVFLLIAGVCSIVQSVNPSFLVQADAASLSMSRSSQVLSIIGLLLFLSGLLIIILKIVKGRTNYGKERK